MHSSNNTDIQYNIYSPCTRTFQSDKEAYKFNIQYVNN